MEVGVRELRQRLSWYLSEVKAGRTVTITEKGVPVADLQPVQPASSDVPPPHLIPLIRAGKLTWPTERWDPNFEPIDLLPGDKTTTDYIREDRDGA